VHGIWLNLILREETKRLQLRQQRPEGKLLQNPHAAGETHIQFPIKMGASLQLPMPCPLRTTKSKSFLAFLPQ